MVGDATPVLLFATLKGPKWIYPWHRAQGLLRIACCYYFPISTSLFCAYMSQESAMCVALSWIHVWWKCVGRRGLVTAWAPVTTSSLLPLFVQSTSYWCAPLQDPWGKLSVFKVIWHVENVNKSSDSLAKDIGKHAKEGGWLDRHSESAR